jgi:hypothetical protein
MSHAHTPPNPVSMLLSGGLRRWPFSGARGLLAAFPRRYDAAERDLTAGLHFDLMLAAQDGAVTSALQSRNALPRPDTGAAADVSGELGASRAVMAGSARDRLGPARGLMLGLALSGAVWAALIAGIWVGVWAAFGH